MGRQNMTCGIYKLSFNGTDKVYIGQSRDIEKRYYKHCSDLNLGKASAKLQQAYSIYGEPTMNILLECEESELNSTENEAIEVYNSVDNGFNTLYYSEDTPIPTNPCKGETNGKSVVTNTQILLAFNILVADYTIPISEVSSYSGVHSSTVYHILEGVGHTWLKDECPVEYEYLMSLRHTRMSIGKSALSQGIVYPIILSPNGTAYSVTNTRKFSREHGLDHGALGKVLNKKAIHHKGWKLQ